jgi:hypothetical protein
MNCRREVRRDGLWEPQEMWKGKKGGCNWYSVAELGMRRGGGVGYRGTKRRFVSSLVCFLADIFCLFVVVIGLFVCFIKDTGSVCNYPAWYGVCFVCQAGFKFTDVLLPLPPESWDGRHMPPGLASKIILKDLCSIIKVVKEATALLTIWIQNVLLSGT